MSFRWQLPIGDARIAYIGAKILEEMDGNDWKATLTGSRYRDYWYPDTVTDFFDETPLRPRAMLKRSREGDLWFIRGAYLLSHARAMIAGYLSTNVAELAVYWNPAMWSAAMSLFTDATNQFGALRPECRFFGHSFGAGIATCMSQIYYLNRPFMPGRSVFAYGMPRTFVVGDPEQRPYPAVARFWNPNDSVLRLCPLSNEAAVGHFLLGAGLSARLNSFRHIGVPFKCHPTEETKMEELPILNSMTTWPDISQWMLAVLNGETNDHSIRTYRENLGKDLTQAELQSAFALMEAPANQLPAPNQGAILAPAMQPLPPAVVAQLLGEQVAVQQQQAQVFAGTYTPRYFRPKRVSRVWGVYNAARCIRVCPSKRKARSMSRRGNRLVSEIRAAGGTDFSSAETAVRSMV